MSNLYYSCALRRLLTAEEAKGLGLSGGARRQFGLGDAVASVATPIARVLRLSCIDPVTRQLRPESGCARRKANWNRKLPNINPLSR